MISKSYFFRLAILISILFFVLETKLNGQSYNVLTNKNYEIEAKVHYGAFMHHHFEMKRFNATFPSYELSVSRATFGKERWEILYHYPLIGLTFYHSGLGNFKEIGSVYALYPFIGFPLNNNPKSKIVLKLGVGLSYLTEKFDNFDNFQNFSIGSHVNAAVNLSFEYRQLITPRLHFVGSFGLTHFSNGSTRTPNYGLNILSFAGGFAYYIKNPNPRLTTKIIPDLYIFEFDGKRWFSVDAEMAFGVKDLTQEYGTHNMYNVYNFSANVMKQFSDRGKFGISFELVKDNSDKAILHMNNISYKKESELLKPGIGASYEMLMDRMSFLFNLGWHLAGKDQSEGSFYQKLSLRYVIYGNMFTTLNLTTHYARADYLGLGLGYRFDFKYYRNKHEKKHPNLLDN